MKKVYRPEDIADGLAVSRKTVYLWLQTGQLVGFKVGKLWRITREDLLNFLGRDIPWEDD